MTCPVGSACRPATYLPSQNLGGFGIGRCPFVLILRQLGSLAPQPLHHRLCGSGGHFVGRGSCQAPSKANPWCQPRFCTTDRYVTGRWPRRLPRGGLECIRRSNLSPTQTSTAVATPVLPPPPDTLAQKGCGNPWPPVPAKPSATDHVSCRRSCPRA